MNNRWRLQVGVMCCIADRTMRKAIKEVSPSEFWTKARNVQNIWKKAMAIVDSRGYTGIEKRSKRR